MNIILLIFIIMGLAFYVYGREKTWVAFFGSADMGAVDFANFIPSKKPNHALFCPQDYCPHAERKTTSPVFELSSDSLRAKLFSIINAEQHIEQVAADDENLEYRFVQYTPMMRFPDTIRIKIIELEDNKTTLAMFSESQIGYGDASVNYRRLNRWVHALEVE